MVGDAEVEVDLRLVATALQDTRLVRQAGQEPPHERGLAHARLTAHDCHAWLATGGVRQHLLEHPQLDFPSHEHRPSHRELNTTGRGQPLTRRYRQASSPLGA